MNKDFTHSEADWFSDLPNKQRRIIQANNALTSKPARSKRYRELYETPEPTPEYVVSETNHNAHLVHATRHYANRLPADRRRSCDVRFPQQQCRRSRRHAEEYSVGKLSTLRDFYTDDAIEKRKRLFASNTNTAPIQILGLEYDILIGDYFMIIGCIEHTFAEWENISDRDVMKMDGKDGLTFWNKHKSHLLIACQTHQDKMFANQ